MYRKIITAARETRRWAMKNRKSFPRPLNGMCAIASHRLSESLSKENIKHDIVVTDGHVWVETSYWAIDVTATQFHKHFSDPVVVMRKPEYRKIIGKVVDLPARRFSCRDKMEKFLWDMGWDSSQIPRKRSR